MPRAGNRYLLGVEYKAGGNGLNYAEALWSVAEARLAVAGADGTGQPTLPAVPGGVVPGQPGVPTDPSIPAGTGEIFGIPALVMLGSLGIPVAGALAGATLAWLLSLFGARPNPGIISSGGVPETGQANDQGLYWSERPWDEAGPGYVSKDEYERTQAMLKQGYQWTNGGWQTPDEIQQSDQWQQTNQAATAQAEAGLQEKMAGEQQALEQNQAGLEKTTEKLQATSNMLDLKDGLETINQDLLNENIYVLNPLQGDPSLVFDGLSKTGNMLWDATTGWVSPSNGMTCGDYVGETLGKVKKIVGDKYGPGAEVQGIIFEEKSTKNPQGVLDWFDRLNPDNHNLIKVKLPDGSEWAVDFHQHNTGNKPPILRPWNEARKVWEDYMGREFSERISVR